MSVGDFNLLQSGAGIAEAGIGLVGSYSQSKAEQAQADFEASGLNINKKFAEMQAQDALKLGRQSINRTKKEATQLVGSQRAALAAQGVDVNSGSAATIQQDTLTQAELDALTIETNAFKTAFGYKTEAANLATQAKLTKAAGKIKSSQTMLTGGLDAFRTLGPEAIRGFQPRDKRGS